MTPESEKSVCFTGHRPDKLVGHERDGYSEFVASLADLLYNECYSKGVTRFVTGGAQGFDQLAFWAVEKMRRERELEDVENIVYVPFHGQERIWKDNGVFSKTNYAKMLAMADEVVLVTNQANGRSEVVAALMARNRAMIDDTGYLIALNNQRDGRWRDVRGGTASAMQYAEVKGRRIDCVRFGVDSNGSDGIRKLTLLGFDRELEAREW